MIKAKCMNCGLEEVPERLGTLEYKIEGLVKACKGCGGCEFVLMEAD